MDRVLSELFDCSCVIGKLLHTNAIYGIPKSDFGKATHVPLKWYQKERVKVANPFVQSVPCKDAPFTRTEKNSDWEI